jgi:hypothetical protein
MITRELMNVSAMEKNVAWRNAWVRLAERSYRLDHITAQRLVFIRWLAETGRLSDW